MSLFKLSIKYYNKALEYNIEKNGEVDPLTAALVNNIGLCYYYQK